MQRFQNERIKEMRMRCGLSQRALAERLGISNRAISKWECGLSYPSAKNLVELAHVLGVPTDYFFDVDLVHVSASDVAHAGMESLKELYKIGRGPSSSHTIGPERACKRFKERNRTAERVVVILYGSLAKTGKGHDTETVIRKTLQPLEVEVRYENAPLALPHPNTMDLIAYRAGAECDRARVMSVGGGSIVFEGEPTQRPARCYPHTSFQEIAEYCRTNDLRLWQYAQMHEGEELWGYLQTVWDAMKAAIRQGVQQEGVLPGGLNVQRKAKSLFEHQHIDESIETKENRVVCAYAFAVSEQNASGEVIVTAPTCGAAGVLPAVLYYEQNKRGYSDTQVLHALATAGIIGNLIKTNASISGAECGCQVEIGSACAMAAAALGELFELGLEKIEYAAEIAIEHHLGLTCDPICGLVQIPCIERNAVAAMRAINAVNLASLLWNTRKISLDRVIQTMKETGHDMHGAYKETAEAGLAKINLNQDDPQWRKK